MVGREPNTTASGCAKVCCISQLARRVRHAKSPRIGSLAHRAGRLLAAVAAHARYGHPLRFYIRPHCPQCPAVTALKLRLVPVTAARPVGEGNRPYAKWPTLEAVAQPSRFPVSSCPTRRRPVALMAVEAPWHWSVASQVFQSVPAASHHQLAPARPTGASPLRGIGPCAPVCPSAPHGGALGPARRHAAWRRRI